MRLALIDENKCWWHIAKAASTYRHELEMKCYSYDPKDRPRTPEQFGRDYSIMMMATTAYSWNVSEKAYDKILKAIEKIIEEDKEEETNGKEEERDVARADADKE